jgi:hypothetical protein
MPRHQSTLSNIRSKLILRLDKSLTGGSDEGHSYKMKTNATSSLERKPNVNNLLKHVEHINKTIKNIKKHRFDENSNENKLTLDMGGRNSSILLDTLNTPIAFINKSKDGKSGRVKHDKLFSGGYKDIHQNS